MCRHVMVDSSLQQQVTCCAAISFRTDQFQKLTSVITMDNLQTSCLCLGVRLYTFAHCQTKKPRSVSCVLSLLRRCRIGLWHTFTESAVRSLFLSQVNCVSLKRSCATDFGGANRRTQNNPSWWYKTDTAGTSETLVGPAVGTTEAFLYVRRPVNKGSHFSHRFFSQKLH